FHHPEFGEVAAGLGFLSAKGRAEGVDLAQSHGRGFNIKLPRLRQVGLLLKVIDWKERSSSLTGCGREDGRVGQDKPTVVKKIARCPDNLCPDSQDEIGRASCRARARVCRV